MQDAMRPTATALPLQVTVLVWLLLLVPLRNHATAERQVTNTRDLSDRTMSTHGLLGCEDAPYVARTFLQHDRQQPSRSGGGGSGGGGGGAGPPSPERALAHLRRVIKDDASCAKARFELGRVLMSADVDDIAGAHAQFEETYRIVRNVKAPPDGPGIDWYATPLEIQDMQPVAKSSRAKMQHDAQQLAHLLQEGKIARGARVMLCLCVYVLPCYFKSACDCGFPRGCRRHNRHFHCGSFRRVRAHIVHSFVAGASQTEVRLLRETAEMYWEMGT
jgi:hypothetical protein